MAGVVKNAHGHTRQGSVTFGASAKLPILIGGGRWTTIAASPIRDSKKGARKRMNKLPGFGLVERARALAPLIAQEADEIERTRRLTRPVVSALVENGLYRSLSPTSIGGVQTPPA